MHTARYGASATSWNNTIVVAGGRPRRNWKSVQQYDLLRNTWAELPSLTEERTDFSLVNLNGILMAIGGSNYSYFTSELRSVEQFDVEKQQWCLTTPLLEGRSSFAAASIQVMQSK